MGVFGGRVNDVKWSLGIIVTGTAVFNLNPALPEAAAALRPLPILLSIVSALVLTPLLPAVGSPGRIGMRGADKGVGRGSTGKAAVGGNVGVISGAQMTTLLLNVGLIENAFGKRLKISGELDFRR